MTWPWRSRNTMSPAASTSTLGSGRSFSAHATYRVQSVKKSATSAAIGTRCAQNQPVSPWDCQLWRGWAPVGLKDTLRHPPEARNLQAKTGALRRKNAALERDTRKKMG